MCCFACLCVCVRMLDPLEWSYSQLWAAMGVLGVNPGPLEEQPMLLTAEPPLQARVSVYFTGFYLACTFEGYFHPSQRLLVLLLWCLCAWSSDLKHDARLASRLHCFWWEVYSHPPVSSSQHIVSFCAVRSSFPPVRLSILILCGFMCTSVQLVSCTWELLESMNLWVCFLAVFPNIFQSSPFCKGNCIHIWLVKIISHLTNTLSYVFCCCVKTDLT